MHAATRLAGHGASVEKMTGKPGRRPTLFLYEHAWARPLRPRLRALPRLSRLGRLAHGNAPRLLRQRQRDPRHGGPDAQPGRATASHPRARRSGVRLRGSGRARPGTRVAGPHPGAAHRVRPALRRFPRARLRGHDRLQGQRVQWRERAIRRRVRRRPVRDVIIEGVSLIANYRAQFARVIRASSYAALIAKMRGDTDDAPRDRKWVVTVETTPVAPTPLVPHLASSAVVAPPPLAIAAPPAPVAPPPVTVAAPPVTITPPPVAVAAPPVAALPVPT